MRHISRRLIEVALGASPADCVVRGGTVVDVNLHRLLRADVAVCEGRIAAVGDVDRCIGMATGMVSAEGCFLVPGLIDPHIHPEQSKLSINRFIEAALVHGTTSIMCGFDSYAGVAGLESVRFVLDEIRKTPLKVFYSGPSRLPYTTPASTVGRVFGPHEQQIAMNWDESVGMWEYMVESIESQEASVLEMADKLIARGQRPHGHLPVTLGRRLSAAVAAGARDDHESWDASEVTEKLRNGVRVLLRKGSAIDNIRSCIKAVTEGGLPSDRVSLCTDDIDCTDLARLGYMDDLVRHAIKLGVDPITAVQMCTINPARTYLVDHEVGMIAPGREADIVLVKDLTRFTVDRVIANGSLVAEGGELSISIESPHYPPAFFGTMHWDHPVSEKDVYLTVPEDASSAEVLVMDLAPTLLRSGWKGSLPVRQGRVEPDPSRGVNYISVTERHSGAARTASAFISGFGLQKGAFATSLSPDDHNIICVGASVPDMVVAINHLFEIGGGQVVVSDGKKVEEIELPVCGITADVGFKEMAVKEDRVDRALFELGVKMEKPLFAMMFLSITAIPNYAITDKGLVEYETHDYVNPVLSWK